MKVSIITTVYKAEKDLPRLLDSMMAQKSPELEFFLIDNGSPDRCGEICQEYAKRDSRFKVFTINENIGYIRARNIGIQEVDADYIGFCDSDDYLEPRGYDCAIEKIKTSNCDLYLTAYHTVENGTLRKCVLPFEKGEYKGDSVNNRILPQAFGSLKNRAALHGFAWKQIFRRQVLTDYGISFMPELQPYEDQVLNIDVIEKCKHIFVDDTVIYNYIVNTKSITAKLVAQFDPEAEWKRLMLFYKEKRKRASKPIHIEALANQMIGFLYSLALNTAKIKSSTKETAARLMKIVDEEAVRTVVEESTRDFHVREKFVVWAMCNKHYLTLIGTMKIAIKIRGL